MPKTKISEFSATPGNNTDIDGINIAEGCAPSGINDAIRELMSQLKDFQTGVAGDSFNGPVGTTTAAAGAFTTLSSTGNTTLGDASGDAVTINGNANFANVNPTLTAGTANGVAYLNGSKVLTTGSALVFDGSNLGLGVTPSAWNSGNKSLDINTTASFFNAAGGAGIGANAYRDSGGAWRYRVSDFASLYLTNNSQHQWYTAPSGTAGNAISLTQAMTLDASGRLGVGVTSPSHKIDVDGNIQVRTGNNLYLVNSSGSAYVGMNSPADSVLAFYRGTTESARIDSSGRLLVGGTNVNPYLDTTGAGTTAIWKNRLFVSSDSDCGSFNRIGSDGQIYYFYRSGVGVGNISVTTTSTTYNTSSDYRLKENIQPMTGALAKVAALKPVTYKWKADGSDGEGFIAHELAEVVPQCVTGEKDAVDAEGKPVYQGIDTSFLVATLTAAIQEQQAIIEQLKADVAVLKSK